MNKFLEPSSRKVLDRSKYYFFICWLRGKEKVEFTLPAIEVQFPETGEGTGRIVIP